MHHRGAEDAECLLGFDLHKEDPSLLNSERRDDYLSRLPRSDAR